MNINYEVKQFVLAVRIRSRNIDNLRGASPKSMTKLVIQMQEALEDPGMRKHVLAAITGLPITSQTELTQASVSVLIDETLGGKSDHILRKIEENIRKNFIKDPVSFKPWNLFPWQ